MNPEEKILSLLKNKDWKLRYGLNAQIKPDKTSIEMHLTNTTFSRRVYISKTRIIFWEEDKDSTIYESDYKKFFEDLQKIIDRDRKIDTDIWR